MDVTVGHHGELPVLSSVDPTARYTYFGIVSSHGGDDDPVDAGGVAHFVEHLMFSGTETVDDVDRFFELSATSSQAATGTGATELYVVTPTDRAATIGEEVLRMFFAPSFNHLERERSVIRAEIARKRTDPISRIQQSADDLLFGNSPSATRAVIGTPESVASMMVEQLRQAHARLADPARTRLVIVGPTPADRLLEGLWTPTMDGTGAPPRAPFVTRCGQYRFDEATETSFEVRMVRGLDECSSIDRFAFAICLDAVANLMTSRLLARLRDRDGLVYGISAGAVRRSEQLGRLALNFNAPADGLTAAVRGVREELERLRTSPLTSDEIERARYVRAAVASRAQRSPTSVGGSIERGFLRSREVLDVDEVVRAYSATPDERVREYAESLADGWNLLVVGPDAELADAAREEFESVMGAVPSGSSF